MLRTKELVFGFSEMYSIEQEIPFVNLYATGQMVRIETFSQCIGSESLRLRKSVIN